MTQKQANEFMNEQFEHFVNEVITAETEEARIRATDNAHKLFITLTNLNAFEREEGFPESPLSSDIKQ